MVQELFKDVFQEAGFAILVCASILVAVKFMKPEIDKEL
jgi:hypothetical protein